MKVSLSQLVCSFFGRRYRLIPVTTERRLYSTDRAEPLDKYISNVSFAFFVQPIFGASSFYSFSSIVWPMKSQVGILP